MLRSEATGLKGRYVVDTDVRRQVLGPDVAKALLHSVIRDAARRGRIRMGLHVDASSSTGADGLYLAMGGVMDYRTQSGRRDPGVSR